MAITFESPSVTTTSFSPAATHFLVQASPPALAPLAPHLASVIQPCTVVLLPMSSNAIADRANTKHNARQITRIFLMAGFSPFLNFRLRYHTARIHSASKILATPLGSSNLRLVVKMRHPKYTTQNLRNCQRVRMIRTQKLHPQENWRATFSRSDWRVARPSPAWAGRTHILPAWHIPTVLALPFQRPSRRSSSPEPAGYSARSPGRPVRSASARLRTRRASACTRSSHSHQTLRG